MKNFTLLSLLLFYLSCHSQTDIFEKEWIGHITLLGQERYAQVFTSKDTTFLRLPDEGPPGKYPLTSIEQEGAQVKFNTTYNNEKWTFSGTNEENDLLQGTFQTRNITGKFLLHQQLPIDKNDFEPCIGNFQLPSGDFLRVWQRRTYHEVHSPVSHRFAGLRRIGENRYLSSAGETLQFSDLQDGQFQSVEWESSDGQKINAPRAAPIRIEDHLVITSTDTIGASLYLPNTTGKHPACIIPIGAARYERYISDLEAELFATYGIATLIYDNYGYGKSTGNLREKSFVDKQQTTIELFRWLQRHPEIDGSTIGFRGASQGGRIAVMAAAEIPETAFLLLVATPMSTRMNQQLFALAEFHRQRNHSEEAIARSSEVWRQFFLTAADGTIDTAFVEEAQQVRSLYPNMELPNPNLETPPYYPWLDDILNRTSDYLPTVKCPVLCLFGPLDDRVPTQKSIQQLQAGLKKAGQPPAEVIVYDEVVGHSFTLPGFRIVPGLFMDQIRFMQKTLLE
ncbi:MAG: CocE/NonD family hydrolase [Bacteroidota bacterium]